MPIKQLTPNTVAMTPETLYKRLGKIERAAKRKYMFPINFIHDAEMDIGRGRTNEAFGQPTNIRIGTKDIPSCTDHGITIQDVTCVNLFSVLYHELQHTDQMQKYQTMHDLTTKSMAISRMSVVANLDFYRQNHAVCAFESDANLMGLLNTKKYLEKNFPKCDIERLLVKAYVNNDLYADVFAARHANDSKEQISRITFDTVMTDFTAIDQAAFSTRKSYSPAINGQVDPSKELRTIQHSTDEFAIALSQPNPDYDWTPFLNQYMAVKNGGLAGKDTDNMMTCLHFYLYPEHQQFFNVLRNTVLPPEAIFRRPFPEPPENIIDRIRKAGGGIYRDEQYAGLIPPEQIQVSRPPRSSRELDGAMSRIESQPDITDQLQI